MSKPSPTAPSPSRNFDTLLSLATRLLCVPHSPFAFALVDKYGSTVNSYYFVLCITSAHNQFYVLVVDTSENIIEAISHYRVSLRPDTWRSVRCGRQVLTRALPGLIS